MKLEAFSHPKARDMSVPSDDVLLHIPGRMTAVFDGATDSLGRRIKGVPVGRLAAMAAAQAAAGLPTEAAQWPARDILDTLSLAIAKRVPTQANEGPASTTAMIAFEIQEGIRMIGIGDTGFRTNGTDVNISELAPDQVSIPARVALFDLFRSRSISLEECEVASQMCIGRGLRWAVATGTISSAEADGIVNSTLEKLKIPDATDEASQLIRHGLQSQFKLANAEGARLGYGVLNGSRPAMRGAIDQTIPNNGLVSIEIFSDGYLSAPPEVSVESWEACHADLELADPHKIRNIHAVKGSTSATFFDDRTVAIMQFRAAE